MGEIIIRKGKVEVKIPGGELSSAVPLLREFLAVGVKKKRQIVTIQETLQRPAGRLQKAARYG